MIRTGRPHGIFNAEKCIQYLRWIGVEISIEMEQSILDAQKAHRFLNGMKRTIAEGWDWECDAGHVTYIETKRGRAKGALASGSCRCGRLLSVGRCRWVKLRDGTVIDRRPKDSRWLPLDDPGSWRPTDLTT